MTYAHGTCVPPTTTSGQRPQPATLPVYAVTLFNSRGTSLFQCATQSGSEPEAVAWAQSAYGDALVGLGDLRELTDEAASLTVDPARTLVAPARTPGSIKLTYFVRIAGEPRTDGRLRRLRKAEAVALLRGVAEADPALLKVLAGAGTIDLCPAHIWSPRSGWLAIESCFRTADAAGRLRALHPASPALRLAAELIVLRLLLGLQETVRQPLARRWSLASHMMPSATLRALSRTAGPRPPEDLIAWLHDRGHRSLAATLAGEFRR